MPIRYFGQDRMAAWQPERVMERNRNLVKYRPTWGLGPKGMPGSHGEGWNPNIGSIMRDEATIEMDDPRTFPFKKKVPWSQSMGLYWTGSDVRQLAPGSTMSKQPMKAMDDREKEKQSAELMKGFRMLYSASPEMQSLVPIEDWDDMTPNMIRGIMSGLQLMGPATQMDASRRKQEQSGIEQAALSSALGAGEDPLSMMRGYAQAGGSDPGALRAIQAATEKPWQPSTGTLGGRQFMMTSPRSAVWDKGSDEKQLKIPYKGPVIKEDGVTFAWSDKDEAYRAFTPKESWVDEFLKSELGTGSKRPKNPRDPLGLFD